jgi:hypothetical protein
MQHGCENCMTVMHLLQLYRTDAEPIYPPSEGTTPDNP